jgi:hypothetical protein
MVSSRPVSSLAYRVVPSGLVAMPWVRLFGETNILLEVVQPSASMTS